MFVLSSREIFSTYCFKSAINVTFDFFFLFLLNILEFNFLYLFFTVIESLLKKHWLTFFEIILFFTIIWVLIKEI
jgi:hypothetical protein